MCKYSLSHVCCDLGPSFADPTLRMVVVINYFRASLNILRGG